MKKIFNLTIYLSVLLIISAFLDISYAQRIRTTSVFPETSSEETEKTKSQVTRSDRSDRSDRSIYSDSSKQLFKDQRDSEDISEYDQLLPTSDMEEEVLSDFEKFITDGLPSSISIDIRQFGYDFFEELNPNVPPIEEENVSINSFGTIRIYIVGNAKQPGSYIISSISTLVSALFEAGGPSKTGTMRDIQLKRNGETLVHFDMYDFLLKGDKTKDLRIQSEDVILIPPVGPLAGIAGNVKKPAIYELNRETRLLQLIDMAGGLTSIAFKGRVQVQRIENHEFRTLFENDLLDMEDNEEKNFLIKDGDLVKVFSVTESNNTVNLIGAVEKEGEYAINPGVTKIKDVILKAGGVLYYSSNQAELTRLKVTQAGPVTEYINIDISKALIEDPEYNIPLEKNDFIFIRTIPEWSAYQTVDINGEIKFTGTYTIKKGETLSSLIKRAGGYTDNAYLRGAVFTRERVRDIQQKSIAQMAAKIERELFAESSAKISTAVTTEEIAARESETKQKKELIETLYKIKATGRMTIKLAHLRLLKGTEYDIVLEEKDSLFIPKKNSVVTVLGAVMSRGSFVYTRDFDYKDYIGLAGGYTNYADKKNVYVLKVDGTAMKLSSGFFNWNDSKSRWDVAGFEKIKEIEPGDSIVVPEKFEHIAWMRGIKDISQILYQIAVAAAVVVDLL